MIDEDESDENDLPQSSDRSRSESSGNNEINWAEQQFKLDFGDDDESVWGSAENLIEPNGLNIDEFEFNDAVSTATSNTRLHNDRTSSKSSPMNFVKRPPLFKRKADTLSVNSNDTTPVLQKRRLAKKSSGKSEADEAWESQSARDHEAIIAKLQIEEQRIALEREQGERRYKLEEERLELDRLKAQQQADQMNQILSLLITRIPIPKQN
jgi:hypothetical protein